MKAIELRESEVQEQYEVRPHSQTCMHMRYLKKRRSKEGIHVDVPLAMNVVDSVLRLQTLLQLHGRKLTRPPSSVSIWKS